MTAVFGVVDGPTSHLAIDDTISLAGYAIKSPSKTLVRKIVRVIREGEVGYSRSLLTFGICGLGSPISLHLKSWETPPLLWTETVDSYMNAVARSVRLHLRKEGWPELKDEHDESLDGFMLVIFEGRLWVMDACFGLVEISDSIGIGSGGQFVHGAYLGLRDRRLVRTVNESMSEAFRLASERLPDVGVLADRQHSERTAPDED